MIRHDMNSMMAVARPPKIISCSTLFFPARGLEGGAPKGEYVRLTRLNNCGEMVFTCCVWGLHTSRTTRPADTYRRQAAPNSATSAGSVQVSQTHTPQAANRKTHPQIGRT